MQKHVNLVYLVKSFPTNIFLQKLALVQERTSPIKFAHLAEKSENGWISNLSTKGGAAARSGGRRRSPAAPPARSPAAPPAATPATPAPPPLRLQMFINSDKF